MILSPQAERMDVSKSSLGKMLLEEITPVVMILHTPLVEEICQKNKLSLVEMLQPYCSFGKIDVPVRTANDQPYRLQMFKLRLFYASKICQANAEIATEHLKDVVRKASENGLGGTSGDHQSFQIDSPMDDHESMLSLFEDFNREILRSLSFSEHEAFDHPVACLLVVSSKDELPISKFVDIFNTDHLPSLLSEGAMDPKILKHYLLIHDKQEGTPDRAIEILADMRATFGPSSCQLLCINSGLGEACTNNPWTSKEVDGPHAHDIGCFLNSGDLNEIRDVMQDFTSKHIIPYMEQKIRSLNQQVSATRKGFRNQIKNLWWRKGKEDASDSSNGPMYSFSSLESQIRVLGDYAFMLRDYELALSSYRLLSTDYKLDRAWKRYAGVQEMAGLCLFMLDQSRKEAEYYMENAFTTYLKTGEQRNATRCGIWWAEMLKTGGQYRDAANVYLHISNEEPSLHAAVILEQASYCYLRTNPPMLRKYGFHRVLAGNQYNTCSQRKLAIRAYNSALSMYKKYAWSYIRDHIHYNLGRWYAIVGIYEAAVQHMLEVLACTHQSLATQKLFFEDFLHIVQELQKLGKKFDVNSLELPSINLSSLRISYEDHRTYASPSAAHIKESTWQSLEDEMVPSISSIRTNWLESLPKSFSAKKRSESLLCVRGETIRVHISFRNPLQIPIDVKGVSLLCGFSSRSQVQESDTSKFASGEYKVTSNTSAQDDAEVQNAMNDREHDDNPPFVTTEVDFVLNGSDSVTVELNVTPTETGVLTITGVRWTLSGSVVGSHIFSSAPGKKKGGKMRQNLIPWEHELKFVVLESLPKLVGCIHKIPERAYMGELHHLILELSNVSESSVKNIRLSISNPRFLIPGSKEDLDLDFPSSLQDLVVVKEDNGTAMFMNSSKSSVFIFPKDVKIEGKKNFCWPLWFRAGMVGTIFLDLSVYYETESLSDEMSFRTLRMHYTLEVLPSLDVSLQITRFPSSLQEFMVRMDIVNNSHAVEFLLRQVSIIGDHFYLSSLSSHILDSEKQREAQDKADISYSSSAWPGQMLPAGQKMSHLFKITEINKFASVNRETTRSGSLHCDNGQQIYVSNSPLSEFHLQERSSREKESIKEFGSTVDFILISQQVRDNCGVKPNGSSDSLPLSSHHICHCSIDSLCPISWLMEGPQDVRHDFAESFCELRFQVTVRNCSDLVASVGIVFNQREHEVQFGDAGQASGSDQGGWHAISLGNNGKILSDLLEENTSSGKRHSSKSIPPLVWTLSGSAKFKLEPLSSVVIPLKLCVFYPGVYDLSNYELHWDLKPGDAGADESHKDSTKKYSGQSPGHPFYLMALQSCT